jgi:DNA-binding NtrC family response regulator
LLLDDDNFDRQRICRIGRKTDLCLSIDEVDSIAQMEAAVTKVAYDVVMIDYRLPVGDGVQALDRVERHALNPDMAKIMIAGDLAADTAVRALRRGCHDVLRKEALTPDDFRAALLNALYAAREQHRRSDQADLRDALIAALQDMGVRASLQAALMSRPALNDLETVEMEALLASLSDADEFRFH